MTRDWPPVAPLVWAIGMLVMGLYQRLREVLAPLQNTRTVVVALAVEFIVAPLLALLLPQLPLLQLHGERGNIRRSCQR